MTIKTIDDIIAELTALRNVHGNLPVLGDDANSGYLVNPIEVELIWFQYDSSREYHEWHYDKRDDTYQQGLIFR